MRLLCFWASHLGKEVGWRPSSRKGKTEKEMEGWQELGDVCWASGWGLPWGLSPSSWASPRVLWGLSVLCWGPARTQEGTLKRDGWANGEEGLVGRLMLLDTGYTGPGCGWGVRDLKVIAGRERMWAKPGQGGLLTVSGLEALGPWP